jgi:hypothetical protein
MNAESTSQDMVNRLTAKLQAFVDGLPEDEAQALELLLQPAISEDTDEVHGYGSFGADLRFSGLSARGIIIVGGHGSQPSSAKPAPGTRQGIIIVGGKGR